MTMSNPQMLLHSEHFELCRICVLQPENNRHIKFIDIFKPNSNCNELSQQIWDNLGVKVEKGDIRPKLICENCYKLLSDWIEFKKKAAESQIIINYIALKKFGVNTRRFSLPSFNKSDTSLGSNASNCQNKMNKSSDNDTFSCIEISSDNDTSSCIEISSDNDSSFCIEVLSGNDASSCVKVSSDNDAFPCVEVNVNDELLCAESESDDKELDNNCKNNLGNDSATLEELIYCSICKSKNTFDHDCSNNNEKFSTCLVPGCNILSRSLEDLTPHYREHIGMSSGEIMCLHCFKENKRSERDIYGFHTQCYTVNLFKCFTCNTIFNTMPKLASHKLKTHDSQLINISGNYLCFYCEKSSPDLNKINKHIKLCRKNQTKNVEKNVSENSMKHQEPERNVKMSFNDKKNECKKGIDKKFPLAAQQPLFACLEPSCNFIFPNLPVFKFHHRDHFKLRTESMCWECCSPFLDSSALIIHQAKGKCQTPGMFKCFKCSKVFDDLQSLGVHKYIIHDGYLITSKKTIICASCRNEIANKHFKNHMVKCQKIEKKSFA